MSRRRVVSLAGLALISCFAAAKECAAQKAIRPEGICLFDSGALPSILYTFPPDAPSVQLIARVGGSSEPGSDFEIRAASVADVAATEVEGRRILLYNQYVFGPLRSSFEGSWPLLERLAHQVGHHLSQHSFRSEPLARQEEELEADRFAGYTLRRLGASAEVLRKLQGSLPSPAPGSGFPSRDSRSSALGEGWSDRQAEESSSHAFEPGVNGIPMLPEWPPPVASANAAVPRDLLTKADVRPRLFDVANRLESAMDRVGYAERSYFAVPNGFALVARIEAIEADGRPRPGDSRWPTRSSAPRVFSLTSYLRALFSSPQGLYRVIVFIVTNRPFTQSAARGDSPPQQWVWAGSNRLPTVVGFADYTFEYVCTALVYEFEHGSSKKDVRVVLPGNLPGPLHLERSKLLPALRLR